MSGDRAIVLLGANQSGIPMAHYLLKHTIPALNLADKSHTYHLVIVSPNTEYYWKIGSPAAIAGSKNIKTKQLTKPISEILSQYPSTAYKLLLGKATGVNPASKTVDVVLNTSDTTSVPYHSLIIATGTHYDSPLYTTSHGSEVLQSAHVQVLKNLQSAKSIIVAGGGPVGIETTGELASTYPNASITLYPGGTRLLERSVPEKASASAEKQLKALGVKIIPNVKVVSAHSETSQHAGDGSPATVNFDDGTQSTADVYIKALAGRKNTEFLPADWLDDRGAVKADLDTLRATATGAENVYVLGDANQHSDGQFLWASDGVKPAASSLLLDVLAGLRVAAPAKQQKLSTMGGIIVVPIAKGGTGSVKGFAPPGWFVHMMKGKNYLVHFMADQVSGKALVKA